MKIKLPAAVLAMCVAISASGAENVFRFNNGAEPKTLDPALATGMPEITLIGALFEGLVGQDPKTLEPVPGVAASWDISPDGLTYMFHLHECRWSNGEPLTADDFIYAWRRALAPETAAEYAYQLWYIKNARLFSERKAEFDQVGVSAPDAHTIVVTLEQPTPFFLELLAFPTYSPLNKKCVEQFGNRWTRPENIVSNGPFLLKDWKQQDRITFARNPHYWDAATVKLDKIIAFAIIDDNTAWRMYRTGEIDWLRSVPDAIAPTLNKRPDYSTCVSFGTHFYRFNCAKKPFDDPRVRKAFALAIDKRKLCRFVLSGQYAPADSYVPPVLKNYPKADGLAYDPANAAKLLADAGYPGGKDFPRVTLVYNAHKRHEQVAQAVQAMWKDALGVDVNLVAQEWKVYLRTMNQLDYDIIRSAWIGDYLDPNTFLDMFVTNGGNNRTGWGNAHYDSLIAAAAHEADVEKRARIFSEAEKVLVIDEMPIVPLYFDANISMLNRRVRGFFDNSRNLHPFKCIYIGEK